MSDRAARLVGATERRNVAVSDFEVRSEGDELVLDGYASLFESPYEVFGGPTRGGWIEVVDRNEVSPETDPTSDAATSD